MTEMVAIRMMHMKIPTATTMIRIIGGGGGVEFDITGDVTEVVFPILAEIPIAVVANVGVVDEEGMDVVEAEAIADNEGDPLTVREPVPVNEVYEWLRMRCFCKYLSCEYLLW